MKRIIAAAVLAVIGTTSVASAADMATKAPMYKAPAEVVVSNWTGFYIGAHGGYGWNNRNDWDLLAADEGTLGPIGTSSGSNAMKGGLAGGQIGYNWQANQWVFGVQADGSWADIKGSSGNPLNLRDGRCGFAGLRDQTSECQSTIKAMANFTGRVGYLVTPSTLLYVKGGINWSSIDFQVKNDIAFSGTCGPAPLGTYPGYNAVNRTRTAGTAGAGIEQRIGNNFTIFGEYDYIGNSGTSTNLNTGGAGPGSCTADFTSSTNVGNTQLVKFGINYTFGGPVVAKY